MIIEISRLHVHGMKYFIVNNANPIEQVEPSIQTTEHYKYVHTI